MEIMSCCGGTNIQDTGMHKICRARDITLYFEDALHGHSGWLIFGLITLEPVIYFSISTVHPTGVQAYSLRISPTMNWSTNFFPDMEDPAASIPGTSFNACKICVQHSSASRQHFSDYSQVK